jgi:hypothetical protein
VSFDVDVTQGFADMKITQVYQNETSAPMEIVFKMPISDTFSMNTIQARFLLQDGSETCIETRVVEREKAKEKYEDAVASGQTAVMANLPMVHDRFEVNVMTIYLGNFPPMSTLILQATCS